MRIHYLRNLKFIKVKRAAALVYSVYQIDRLEMACLSSGQLRKLDEEPLLYRSVNEREYPIVFLEDFRRTRSCRIDKIFI